MDKNDIIINFCKSNPIVKSYIDQLESQNWVLESQYRALESKYNDREAEEKDKFIYDNISSQYALEWDRFKILDGKASGIIGFVGIILALQGGLGATLIKDAPKIGILFYLLIFIFIISIVMLTLAVYSGLSAYNIREMSFVPEARHLVEEYTSENRSKSDTLQNIGAALVIGIEKNRDKNKEKMKCIKDGFNYLITGLILNLIFIIGVIWITI